MIEVKRYHEENMREWNDFVAASRNATFLHNRLFMDYHSDRFDDHSLMFYRRGKLSALLPAAVSETEGCKTLHSHRGLTYGGLLLPPHHCDAGDIMQIFQALADYCHEQEITLIDYTPVPYIYCKAPSEEDVYALWRMGAEMSVCNLSVAIDLQHNPGFDTRQRRNCRKAEKTECNIRKIGDDEEIVLFHAMLSRCLSERHSAVPVHTVDELVLLHSRFPSEIEFYVVESKGEMQAGVMLFDCGMTVHAQYICSTPTAREHGLLSLLMQSVINQSAMHGARYFDFGICNEDAGRYLNVGLAAQKYGLGGTGVAYPRFRLSVGEQLTQPDRY